MAKSDAKILINCNYYTENYDIFKNGLTVNRYELNDFNGFPSRQKRYVFVYSDAYLFVSD